MKQFTLSSTAYNGNNIDAIKREIYRGKYANIPSQFILEELIADGSNLDNLFTQEIQGKLSNAINRSYIYLTEPTEPFQFYLYCTDPIAECNASIIAYRNSMLQSKDQIKTLKKRLKQLNNIAKKIENKNEKAS